MPKPNRRGLWRSAGGAARIPPARPNLQDEFAVSDAEVVPSHEDDDYDALPSMSQGIDPDCEVLSDSAPSLGTSNPSLGTSPVQVLSPRDRTKKSSVKRSKKFRPPVESPDCYILEQPPKQRSPSPPRAGDEIFEQRDSPPSAGADAVATELAVRFLKKKREAVPLQAELAQLREENLQLQLEAAARTYEAIKQRIAQASEPVIGFNNPEPTFTSASHLGPLGGAPSGKLVSHLADLERERAAVMAAAALAVADEEKQFIAAEAAAVLAEAAQEEALQEAKAAAIIEAAAVAAAAAAAVIEAAAAVAESQAAAAAQAIAKEISQKLEAAAHLKFHAEASELARRAPAPAKASVATGMPPPLNKSSSYLPVLPPFSSEPARESEDEEDALRTRDSTPSTPGSSPRDPCFTSRLEVLIRGGVPYHEAEAALRATRDLHDFSYSSRAAIAYLNEKKEREASQARLKAKEAADKLDPAGADAVLKADGKVEAFLEARPESAELVSFLLTQHHKRRTGHHKSLAVAATNLLSNTEVASSLRATAGSCGSIFSLAAHAVVDDCARCTDLREKDEKQKRDTADKKAAVELKEQAMQQHRLQLAEAALQVRGKESRDQPITLNFRTKDSKRNVSLKHQRCCRCNVGRKGGKWLYYCDFCNNGFHKGCEEFCLLVHRTNKKELWACGRCKASKTDVLPSACDYLIAKHNLANNSAPRSGPASPEADALRPPVVGSILAHYGGAADPHRQRCGGGASAQGTGTPPLPSSDDEENEDADDPTTPSRSNRPESSILDHSSTKAQQTPGNRPEASVLDTPPARTLLGTTDRASPVNTALNFSDQNFGASQSDGTFPSKRATPQGSSTTTPVMRMEDYSRWEDTPKGQKTSEVHATRGWGKIPYQNWRRTNVSRRDACRNTAHELGQLSLRALSTEMRQSIGGNLLNERSLWHHCAEVNRLFELKKGTSDYRYAAPPLDYTELTDKDVDTWVDKDPIYDWVGRIPDDELLGLLDRRFGVHKPDLFLAKKFPSNLPKTLPNGDVNYCSQDFVTWSSEWASERNELISSRCDLSQIDMKQTLLNAVSTNQIIHDAASQCSSSSIHHILAHLRTWLRNEEDTQATARQRREKLLGDPSNRLPSPQSNQPKSSPATTPSVRAGALVTDAKSEPRKPRDMPLHLTAIPSGKSVKCNGCGNVYDLSKKCQCWNACRFDEHPRYNTRCKTLEWAGCDVNITWRNFRIDYPGIHPLPVQFLSWEAWTQKSQSDKKSKYEASKRPRDGKP
jgi:hypothetical protein